MANRLSPEFLAGWSAEVWVCQRCPIRSREAADKWVTYYEHLMARAMSAGRGDNFAYFQGKAAAVRSMWGH